jgi:hypothetical protein
MSISFQVLVRGRQPGRFSKINPQVELELELSFGRKEEEAWCEVFWFDNSLS